MKMRTKVMLSRLTGRLTIYGLTQQIAATEKIDYDVNLLRDAYNDELLYQSVDAHVESCKQIRGLFQDNLEINTWVATTEVTVAGKQELLIPVVLIPLIIAIIKIVAFTVASLVILSAAASFVERIFPRPTFYAPDGTSFDSLASYLSYMQNVWNPAQGANYTCMYCGQGFTTEAERDTHQDQCPWTGGPPDGGFDWLVWVVAGLGIIGLTAVAVTVFKPSPRAW